MQIESQRGQAVLAQAWRCWDRHVPHPYHPEKHYMRGGRAGRSASAANDDRAVSRETAHEARQSAPPVTGSTFEAVPG